MSDKPLSRRALRPRRSGERTMRHGAPGGCGSALNFARQLPNALSGIPWASQYSRLIQLAPTPLVTV